MRRELMVIAFLFTASARGQAQIASPYADGSDGAFVFVGDAGNPNTMTIDLGLAAAGGAINWMTPSPVAGRGVYDPKEWLVVFKYSTVTVPAGKTVKFKNHPKNPPVAWLVSGGVTIDGTVDLSALDLYGFTSNVSTPGPGGFPGGLIAVGPTSSGAGYGPGGGNRYADFNGFPAGHRTKGQLSAPQPWMLAYVGDRYGNDECLPLLGGSGGAGGDQVKYAVSPIAGGSGGGGAILVASNATIALHGIIKANGGSSYTAFGSHGAGSGGTIRLLAQQVVGTEGSSLQARGSSDGSTTSSDGRIRIEQASLTGLGPVAIVPTPSLPSVPGYTGPIVPSGNPTITIASIGGATAPADPSGSPEFFKEDLSVQPGTTSVIVHTQNVPQTWVVYVRSIPRSGEATVINASLSGTSGGKLVWTANLPLAVGQTTLLARAYDPAVYP